MEIKKVLSFIDRETFQPKLRVVADFTFEVIEDSKNNEFFKSEFFDKFFGSIDKFREENPTSSENLIIVPLKNFSFFTPVNISNIKEFKNWIPSDVINLGIASTPCFLDKNNKPRENYSKVIDITIDDQRYEKLKVDVNACIDLYKEVEANLISDGKEYFYCMSVNKNINPDTFLSEFKIIARSS